MTTITLESIKAEQSKLAAMIATFEEQATKPQEVIFPEALITLQPGEEYAGLVVGKASNPSYHLILLPGQATDIAWENAKAWAKGQGGELPTRREQSLLFANLKEHFDERAYWSCEEYSSEPGWAWFQHFDSGHQDGYHKGTELRARAVRRLVIE